MRYTLLAAALFCASLFAQPSLTFEVASVKPAAPPAGGPVVVYGRGGPGSNDTTRLNLTNATLMSLITRAYDVKRYQVTGPAWLEDERFDVIAKIPPDTTKEQSNIMLRNLLADRFHLKLRHESKEFQGYELVIGKGGSKLKPSSAEDAAFDQSQPPAGPPSPPKRDANGAPILERPGMLAMMRVNSHATISSRMTARAQTLAQLLNMIGRQLNKPVVDKTGLTGKYDFTLEYAGEMPAGMLSNGMPPPPPPPPGGPASAEPQEEVTQTLPGALQQQLGLRLDAKKIQLDTLIIESADKVPTEN